MVADTGTFQEWFTDLETENPLEYPGYEEKIANLQEKTKLHEAVTVGKCMVNGLETVLGVCDARFLMGSMGYVVGEKLRELLNGRRKKNFRWYCLPVPVVPGCRRESYL